MAKPKNDLAGSVVIPAADINLLVIGAIGLPDDFFITLGKAKLDSQTGDLSCDYTASTEAAPPPPPEV